MHLKPLGKMCFTLEQVLFLFHRMFYFTLEHALCFSTASTFSKQIYGKFLSQVVSIQSLTYTHNWIGKNSNFNINLYFSVSVFSFCI